MAQLALLCHVAGGRAGAPYDQAFRQLDGLSQRNEALEEHAQRDLG